MTFMMLVVELSHTTGLCLLVFRILPCVDMMRGLVLMTSIYFFPSLWKMCSFRQGGGSRCMKTALKFLIGLVTVGIQVASIVVCSNSSFSFPENMRQSLVDQADNPEAPGNTVVRSGPGTHADLVWEVPVSLVLISIAYWENFLDSDLKVFRWSIPLSTWKKDVHLVRQRLYIFLSLWKIIWSVLFAVLMVDGFTFSIEFSHNPGADTSPSDMHLAQYGPLYASLVSSVLCSYFSGLACKLSMQRLSFSLPLTLVTPVSLGMIMLRCRLDIPDIQAGCYLWVCPEAWSDLLPYHLALLGAVWLSQCLLLSHIWQADSERMAKIDKLFITPMRCAVLTDQTLMLRRRTPSNEKILQKGLDETSYFSRQSDSSVPQIFACATMWHETRSEMTKLLKSIFRMDIDHSARAIAQKYYKISDPDYYHFEAHIFFDDAFELSDDEKVVPNSFVLRMIECLDEAISSVHERPTTMPAPERTPTPYGGCLNWTLPGGTSLVVHLKDIKKIRNRKRWSQVMYLYYLLGYNILANDERGSEFDFDRASSHNGAGSGDKIRLTSAQLRKRRRSAFFSRSVIFNYVTEEVQSKAENTYILTLDGDVDFRPEAVRLLIDRMKKNKKVGAACGRIHPIGSGPIVWYQQFEYAIGHWLQKATEHVFGCVLCAPGCFSLFRGSALMDDNVARMYATKSSEAGHYVQFDQGEDRWLSTLLLQQGYRIDYCAAADAFTQAPETFNEFFNQRRRWGPSTLANILDLLGDWKNTVHINDNISSLYVFYQTMMFVSTLLGPATVLLMMAGAYQVVFKITVLESYCLAIIPAAAYVLVCMFSKTDTQLLVGAVMSAVYAIVMTVVLVGTVGTAISGSVTSPNVIFMVMLTVIFITSGFMHPRELGCLVPGALYFICIPSGYLVLTIYFLTNLHIVSWGTREVPKKKTKEELEKEKAAEEKKQQRKVEKKSGVLGWLGVRYILSEIGEMIKQFRALLFETGRGQESPEHQSSPAKIKTKSGSNAQTNELLQQLVEELKSSRHMGSQYKATSYEPEVKQRLSSTHTDTLGHEVHDTPDARPGMEPGICVGEAVSIGDQRPAVAPSVGTSRSLTIREDPARPLWIHHVALGDGPIKQLAARERVFWTQLLSKYLHPVVEDSQHKQRIHKDLLALRNNVVFAFFMTSAVWIALFMQLEILQAELKSHLFVHIPRIDRDGTLSFQPLGLVFLGCFSIILLLQFLGMFTHRWGTMLHTLSITDIGLGQRLKEQDKVKDIIIRVSQLQKLRNIEMEPQPDYEEPLPDYFDDIESSVGEDNAALGQDEEHGYTNGQAAGFTTATVHQPRPSGANGWSGDKPPSFPPSYHTQEVPPSPLYGHVGALRPTDVFDRSGHPRAFALENAFERRFRNELRQRHRQTDLMIEMDSYLKRPEYGLQQLQPQQQQQQQQQQQPQQHQQLKTVQQQHLHQQQQHRLHQELQSRSFRNVSDRSSYMRGTQYGGSNPHHGF